MKARVVAVVIPESQLMLTPSVRDQAKELLKRATKTKTFAKVGLALATITFNVCTGLALPMANFEAALGTTAGGALSTLIEDLLTSGFGAMASIAGEKLGSARPADLLQHAGAHRHGIQKVKQFWRLRSVTLKAIGNPPIFDL